MNWQQFYAAAKRYWNGAQDKEATTAGGYLIRCPKEPRQKKVIVVSAAFKLFKSENQTA